MTIATFGLNTTNTVQQWEDVYLSQQQPGIVSPGGINTLYVSNTDGIKQNKIVFRAPGIKTFFDGVGAVVINSAILKWRRSNTVAGPSRNLEVRRLLVSFGETQSTWNNRLSGTAWGTAGAIGAGDVDSTILASAAIPTSGGAYFNISGSGFTAWVAGIVDGSITTDFGFTVSLENPTTSGSGDFDFNSSNSTNGLRPYLEIDYTTIAYPTVSTTDVTVNNLSGNAIVTITLSSDALAGGVNGTVNTADITAIDGVDYTAQTGVAFSIPEGSASGTITIPILP